MVTLFKIGN